MIADDDGQRQMLSGGAKAAFAYDPYNGRELWRIEFDDFSIAPRPLYRDGIAYMVTGITHPELWAIDTQGRGDLTESEHIKWRLTSGVSKTASPLLVDGLIYMISDDGVVNCVDERQRRARVAKADRRPVCCLTHLWRWSHLLLRPGWQNDRPQTGTHF